MGYGVEVTAQVRVDDLKLPSFNPRLDRRHCLMGIASRSVGVTVLVHICLKDRHQHQHRRRLHHPVFYRRYAQRPLLPIRFGDVDPQYRTGPVPFALQLLRQGFYPRLSFPCFFRGLVNDLLDLHPVHSGTSPVTGHLCQRRFQNVLARQLAIQTPEPILRLRLCFPIERSLQLPNFFRGYYSGPLV